jgi:hypothetical protein
MPTRRMCSNNGPYRMWASGCTSNRYGRGNSSRTEVIAQARRGSTSPVTTRSTSEE